MSEDQLLELAASQCCICDGVLNIGVAHVLLHGTKVNTLVDQMNPAGMAQCVGIPFDTHHGLAQAMEHFAEAVDADGAAALIDEHVPMRSTALTLIALERSHRVSLERMCPIK